jgi:hypothetical protein
MSRSSQRRVLSVERSVTGPARVSGLLADPAHAGRPLPDERFEGGSRLRAAVEQSGDYNNARSLRGEPHWPQWRPTSP